MKILILFQEEFISFFILQQLNRYSLCNQGIQLSIDCISQVLPISFGSSNLAAISNNLSLAFRVFFGLLNCYQFISCLRFVLISLILLKNGSCLALIYSECRRSSSSLMIVYSFFRAYHFQYR
jgi:hypothetical protein